MSIRLDPRRLGTLKQLAAEADVRPGDLVRQWVEERIDAARGGARPGGRPRTDRVLGLIAAHRGAAGRAGGRCAVRPRHRRAPEPAKQPEAIREAAPSTPASRSPRRRRSSPRSAKRVSAAPSGEHVALHDEMIAVIRERGPLSAADLAAAVVERGRYAPPRSKKPLDAAMVSQRVSNPTYRPLLHARRGTHRPGRVIGRRSAAGRIGLSPRGRRSRGCWPGTRSRRRDRRSRAAP